MPFVSVKCTSCGGDIQLDNERETGFCSYCGSKVIFEEAFHKMELSGQVSVDGIPTIEQLINNAQVFKKLGNYSKAGEILLQITDDYPKPYDFRYFM